MHIAELLGYLASALVFATFCMKSMRPLRLVAIASNATFIAYGWFGGMMPILVLHIALLPLNLWRLAQEIKAAQQRRAAGPGLERLLPHAAIRRFGAGETIFRKGDLAGEVYAILSGTVRLTELGIEIGPGTIFGEIGVFSARKSRIASAIATAPLELLAIPEERIVSLCNEDPQFGLQLMTLITTRMVVNLEEFDKLKTGSAKNNGSAYDFSLIFAPAQA